MRSLSFLIPLAILVSAVLLPAQQGGKGKKKTPPKLQWRIQKLHQDNNEGCAVGDIDGDGKLDITAGEFWYRAPDFEQLPLRKLMPFGKDYLQNNSEHLHDVDGDGDLDVVAGAFTLPLVHWFENPGPEGDYSEPWKAHQLVDTGTGHNEATFFRDFDGDGVPEWIENSWKPDNPMQIFRFADKDDEGAGAEGSAPAMVKHIVSESGNGHGMGFGDIDGDGREDIVFQDGWYQRPADGPFSGPWEHRADFTLPHASCPVLVTDLNGDGRNDILWGDGHSYGLYWEEQLEPRADGTTVWRQHLIDKKFSQAHCLARADIDGDGDPELITGKRYYAHSGRDAGAHDPTTLHYYDWNPGDRTWRKHTISQTEPGEGPGTGLQIRVADLDGNGFADIVTSGKSGTHISWNEGWNRPE